MKEFSRIAIFLTVLLGACPIMAQQADFDRANELLTDSRYRDALELYKELEKEGHESGALWLNMGISYSQLDSLGMSKYYFLRALEYPETKYRAEEALDYVNNRFSYQSAVLPQLPWNRIMESIRHSPGVTNLAYLSLFFLYLGTLIMIFSWFRKRRSKVLTYGKIVSYLLAFLILSLAALIHYQDSRYGTGVVITRQGQVFQNPDESSAAVSTAHEGYLLRVDYKESSEQEEWLSIRLENGMYGWIREHNVKDF